MRAGRLTSLLLERWRTWDRASRLALVLTAVLLLLILVIANRAPADVRPLALIGLVGLLIMAQILILWASRRDMLAPYSLAQRRYLAEDFEGARALLETMRADGRADMRELTLLGNTYRQLGLLDESEAVLSEALDKRPDHHFPLYGFGRTLLSKGDYAGAVEVIERALAAGAPAAVQIDHGEALYRAGLHEAARQVLEAAEQSDEPHRALLAAYLLYRLGAAPPPTRDLVRAGLSYWSASAGRFAHTPYGQALAEDVRHLEGLAQED